MFPHLAVVTWVLHPEGFWVSDLEDETICVAYTYFVVVNITCCPGYLYIAWQLSACIYVAINLYRMLLENTCQENHLVVAQSKDTVDGIVVCRLSPAPNYPDRVCWSDAYRENLTRGPARHCSSLPKAIVSLYNIPLAVMLGSAGRASLLPEIHVRCASPLTESMC